MKSFCTNNIALQRRANQRNNCNTHQSHNIIKDVVPKPPHTVVADVYGFPQQQQQQRCTSKMYTSTAIVSTGSAVKSPLAFNDYRPIRNCSSKLRNTIADKKWGCSNHNVLSIGMSDDDGKGSDYSTILSSTQNEIVKNANSEKYRMEVVGRPRTSNRRHDDADHHKATSNNKGKMLNQQKTNPTTANNEQYAISDPPPSYCSQSPIQHPLTRSTFNEQCNQVWSSSNDQSKRSPLWCRRRQQVSTKGVSNKPKVSKQLYEQHSKPTFRYNTNDVHNSVLPVTYVVRKEIWLPSSNSMQVIIPKLEDDTHSSSTPYAKMISQNEKTIAPVQKVEMSRMTAAIHQPRQFHKPGQTWSNNTGVQKSSNARRGNKIHESTSSDYAGGGGGSVIKPNDHMSTQRLPSRTHPFMTPVLQNDSLSQSRKQTNSREFITFQRSLTPSLTKWVVKNAGQQQSTDERCLAVKRVRTNGRVSDYGMFDKRRATSLPKDVSVSAMKWSTAASFTHNSDHTVPNKATTRNTQKPNYLEHSISTPNNDYAISTSQPYIIQKPKVTSIKPHFVQSTKTPETFGTSGSSEKGTNLVNINKRYHQSDDINQLTISSGQSQAFQLKSILRNAVRRHPLDAKSVRSSDRIATNTRVCGHLPRKTVTFV